MTLPIIVSNILSEINKQNELQALFLCKITYIKFNIFPAVLASVSQQKNALQSYLTFYKIKGSPMDSRVEVKMTYTARGRVTKRTETHVHMRLLNKTIQNSPGVLCFSNSVGSNSYLMPTQLKQPKYCIFDASHCIKHVWVCMCVPQITEGHRKSLSHTRLSLVTMRTRTDWSKALHTHRPCLSGLQSRLAIG